jgi:hypothetical protein
MPAITATSMTGSLARTLTETTLNGSTDSLTYNSDRRPVLTLRNPTAGALTPVIDGDGGTTVAVAGVGSVSVSSGYSVGSIAAGAAVAVPLDTIKEYLRGTIAVTGGTGLVAALLEF